MRRIAAAALLALGSAPAAHGLDANGYALQPAPLVSVMSMPFVRIGAGDPIIFDAITTTPKQFAISKPPSATTYRLVNPCDVDVRIREVASMAVSVTPTTGTRYLARTVEVVGASSTAFVSVMTVKVPGETCSPELQFGNGS